MKAYKYHYIVYKQNIYTGRWEECGKARDKKEFDEIIDTLNWVLSNPRLSYERKRISVEEWKRRYC